MGCFWYIVLFFSGTRESWLVADYGFTTTQWGRIIPFSICTSSEWSGKIAMWPFTGDSRKP
jgi:hypothetical protein